MVPCSKIHHWPVMFFLPCGVKGREPTIAAEVFVDLHLGGTATS